MTDLDARAAALRLSVDVPDDAVGRDQLGSLYAWLREVDALRGVVALRGAPPVAGTMGAALDVITVAVGSGGAAGVLARSVVSWLIQGRRSDVKVTVTTENGRSVEIDVRGARDPEALMRQVADMARRPAGSDD
ncbi:effector-associated constant component EACC1 [Streptomyces sp. NBC_01716]|uniref:effector-associated constant component EACC1 n=1 Tax=Streptomyces sp. NBC_01716 TaxID=2975917 RepID=UPI002E373655|nr:hypothetical protein [Streptomyces sp. NBC_01716]